MLGDANARSDDIESCRFTDIAELTARIRMANANFMAAAPGPFGGEFQRVSFGPVIVQFVKVSHDSVSRGKNGAGRFGYLVQLAGADACVWNGHPVPAGGVITYGPDADHSGFAPAGVGIAMVSVPVEHLRQCLGAVPPGLSERLERGSHRVDLALPERVSLCWRLLLLRTMVTSSPELLAVPATRETFARWLGECLRWLVERAADAGTPPGDATERGEWLQLLRNAEEHLTRQAVGEEVHLRSLCRALGVTRKSLRRACRELLRMEPAGYLERFRLQNVRADAPVGSA